MKKEQAVVAIFAGTTEGRLLASYLAGSGIRTDVFVATEYGKEEIPKAGNLSVHVGRMDAIRMEELFKEKSYDLILDATHPFAVVVTENIRKAAETVKTPLLRILRDKTGKISDENGSYIVRAASISEAVEFLKTTSGAILVTTGSKELAEFLKLPDWENRVYARVLSTPKVVKACGDLGFYGSHLIAMQGPFSEELNLAMMKAVHAAWMVTKESGKAGGFEEKVRAAKKAGVGLVVIGRPREDGISLMDGMRYVKERFDLTKEIPEQTERDMQKKRRVFLIGTGPGNPEYLTVKAKKCLEDCDLIVGADRMIRQLGYLQKPVFVSYQADQIADFLDLHKEAKVICAAMSGDTGFYSGAETLNRELKKRGGYEVEIIPGISSVGYFFSRIGRSWDHAMLFSMHGKEANFAAELKRHGRAFILGGSPDFYGKICEQLIQLGMEATHLFAGENLTMEHEVILSAAPDELKVRKAPPLAVLYGEWEGEKRALSHGLSDEAFLRGNVPMTKMEVRALSVAKLALQRGSILYDVGAGTGSVSVECAGLSDSVQVYAVEKNPEAIGLLEENRMKFALTNLKIVEGRAPEVLEELPSPTHVFIGGSNGNMEEIIALCLRKNPGARFVINLITPESLAAVLKAVKSLPVTEAEFVTLTAARSKQVGDSHLMMGQNPVWIVTFEGRKEQ